MTDSPNDPAGPTDPAGPDASESARRHPLRRLARAMVSPDSYGSVLLLILFTYGFSVGVTASWAASLVITVQIGTVWAVLHVSRARRSVRRAASVLLLISALVAAVNLFVGKETTGEGAVAFMSAVLYLIAPFSITRSLLFRREVDLQTVLGAIDIYLLVGMLFAFIYRFLGVVQSSAFFGTAVGDGKFPQDLFFSFTTLTTTGYGNYVPAGNPGQSFAVAEMLVGQLFLVTAVAKVINAYTPTRAPISRSQQTGGKAAGESPGGEGP
jgi:Ion channel